MHFSFALVTGWKIKFICFESMWKWKPGCSFGCKVKLWSMLGCKVKLWSMQAIERYHFHSTLRGGRIPWFSLTMWHGLGTFSQLAPSTPSQVACIWGTFFWVKLSTYTFYWHLTPTYSSRQKEKRNRKGVQFRLLTTTNSQCLYSYFTRNYSFHIWFESVSVQFVLGHSTQNIQWLHSTCRLWGWKKKLHSSYPHVMPRDQILWC